MEISDGGATAREFAREDNAMVDQMNISYTDSEADNSEMIDDDTEVEGTESGEIVSEAESGEEDAPQAKRVKQRKSTQKRNSVEQQLANMSSTLLAMQELMAKNGLAMPGQSTDNLNSQNSPHETEEHDKNSKGENTSGGSETTIYQNVLGKDADLCGERENGNIKVFQADSEIAFKLNENSKRAKELQHSSSSEDGQVDTSDDLIDMEINNVNVDNFIADCASEANRRKRSLLQEENEWDLNTAAQEEVEMHIREAESSRARIMMIPGNDNTQCSNLVNRFQVGQLAAKHHSSLVDDNYLVIGGHVDPVLRGKIIRGEYVDFARLLPKNRSYNDDGRLELVNRGGQTYFVPANRDLRAISNFHKWEQAFQIFSNIYTKEYPDRASELIQYNHIIFTVSSTYIWDNVYNYDREFRTHLSYYPERSWSIILQ